LKEYLLLRRTGGKRANSNKSIVLLKLDLYQSPAQPVGNFWARRLRLKGGDEDGL